MLVYLPNDDPKIRPVLTEITVVWEDETHVVGDLVVKRGTPLQRVLVAKEDIPTQAQIDEDDAARICEKIREWVPLNHRDLSLASLRQIEYIIDKQR